VSGGTESLITTYCRVRVSGILLMTETRNIIDHYHYWKHESILADLDKRRHNFTVLCSNLYNDFNIATVIRNSNAFLAKEVILYGSKQYDRRGTVGTHNYNRFVHCRDEQQIEQKIESMIREHGTIRIVGIDNVRNARPIEDYSWPNNEHVLMIFGQEQIGVPNNVLDMCDDVLYIPQYGSVRSINVGTASGIIMNNYCSKIHSFVV